MKKIILMAIAGLIGGSTSALANVERTRNLTSLQKKQIAWAIKILARNGDPGMTRTCDLLLRRQLLYPTELRDRTAIQLGLSRTRFVGGCQFPSEAAWLWGCGS